MSRDEDQLKMAAAESAVTQVTGGMIVGLGSGSTAAFAVSALGRQVREGLRIVGIPTSERTAAQARELGIPLSTLSEQPRVDITIDGADEVEEGTLNLIKGHGGALLREKIVAISSERLVIVIHDSKLVKHLGISYPVPVEVVPFGWQTTARHLADLGTKPVTAAKSGWRTLPERRWELHPGLLVRAGRLSGVVGDSARSCGRPGGAWFLHRTRPRRFT